MMRRRLRYTVHLHQEDGSTLVFGPDDEVPPEVAALITNPKAWADDHEQPAPSAQPVAVNLAGPGGLVYDDAARVAAAIVARLPEYDQERIEQALRETFADGPAPEEIEDIGQGEDRHAGDDSTAAAKDNTIPVPPRSGPGSGSEAWANYARAHDFEVEDGAGREAIIADLTDAGIPVE